ncbi:hypothetical protein SSP24_72950 [Streptomyces spinoverrucosus]|uniref:Uncharacterized protein n=1 Tax=Streptomyces spinoverrucosus TaxID=284043 RepID=A0A4Y3VVD5_9ACTN|nr:hypothetical protein SSP24_72950 [Streptomyces spinoverrucosus]GHB70559.1 hypothetical protein GCM10010397_46040 [Streptomyces spinoverrucosus]
MAACAVRWSARDRLPSWSAPRTLIECNPNGQWGWLPDAQAITEAFADILTRKEAVGHEDAGRP